MLQANILSLLLATFLSFSVTVSASAQKRVPFQSSVKKNITEALNVPIQYTPGRHVLVNGIQVYVIFYGKFAKDEKELVKYFVDNLSSTSWWGITQKYYFQETKSSEKKYVSSSMRVAKMVSDAYSKGTTLSGWDIPDIIEDFIKKGQLPVDPTGIYLFLNSADVAESWLPTPSDPSIAHFCQEYCGYHQSFPLRYTKPDGSGDIRLFYAQAGLYDDECMNGCAPRFNVRMSPNGNPPLDAMLNTIAHELTEATTDPLADLDDQVAWVDSDGQENADKCGNEYGSAKRDRSSKAWYNMEMGDYKFLIQQNWDPEEQQCRSTA